MPTFANLRLTFVSSSNHSLHKTRSRFSFCIRHVDIPTYPSIFRGILSLARELMIGRRCGDAFCHHYSVMRQHLYPSYVIVDRVSKKIQIFRASNLGEIFVKSNLISMLLLLVTLSSNHNTKNLPIST